MFVERIKLSSIFLAVLFVFLLEFGDSRDVTVFKRGKVSLIDETQFKFPKDYSFEDDLEKEADLENVYDEKVPNLPRFLLYKRGEQQGWTKIPVVTRRGGHTWSTPRPATKKGNGYFTWTTPKLEPVTKPTPVAKNAIQTTTEATVKKIHATFETPEEKALIQKKPEELVETTTEKAELAETTEKTTVPPTTTTTTATTTTTTTEVPTTTTTTTEAPTTRPTRKVTTSTTRSPPKMVPKVETLFPAKVSKPDFTKNNLIVERLKTGAFNRVVLPQQRPSRPPSHNVNVIEQHVKSNTLVLAPPKQNFFIPSNLTINANAFTPKKPETTPPPPQVVVHRWSSSWKSWSSWGPDGKVHTGSTRTFTSFDGPATTTPVPKEQKVETSNMAPSARQTHFVFQKPGTSSFHELSRVRMQPRLANSPSSNMSSTSSDQAKPNTQQNPTGFSYTFRRTFSQSGPVQQTNQRPVQNSRPRILKPPVIRPVGQQYRGPTFNCRVLTPEADGRPSPQNDENCPLKYPGFPADDSCKCMYQVEARDERGCATGFLYTCFKK